ncbi:hypothetical protein [Bosea massiliensis]|uniref:Uncharacterized protein n=1 Tax=Bosea massiliensis TaxID=151419 RepID=A0ABW0PCN7_9HYPH
MGTKRETIVCFRTDKRGDHKGDVTAVFPFEDEGRGLMACYAHIGQHSTCDAGWVTGNTRPATAEEYADLKRELESAPYRYRLAIRDRFPSYRTRRAAR